MYQVEIKKAIDLVKEYATYDEQGNELTPAVLKTEEEIASEEQALKDAKQDEVQAKVDVYIAAQQHQLQHGGAGPVAEFEIMKIVNEHNGQFEVIFKEE